MRKLLHSTKEYLFPLIMVITLLPACVVNKKTVYFNDIPDSIKFKEVITSEFKEPVIQSDDVLSISIQTIDPTSIAAPLSTSMTGPYQGTAATNQQTSPVQSLASGFLVDKKGAVSLPMFGELKVSGLTTLQASDLVRQRASVFFKNPVVQIRFLNFKVSIIGEVQKPATYNVTSEKISLLDAISMAGDLTIYGRRDNILVIREGERKSELARLNLNSSDLFKSPYFYLKQNDIVYVEPGKGKVAATNASRGQTYAIIGSIVSVLLVLLSRF